MRLTIDEYCKHFMMSKEMVNSKIKNKKLNYIIEDGVAYIIVTKLSIDKDKINEIHQYQKETIKKNETPKPKTTVATVLALYQRENSSLKNKIAQLETKIDKLIDDKEQMLRDERDKIEKIYASKDDHLKNILELMDSKMRLERQQMAFNEIESFHPSNNAEIIADSEIVELKEHLKSLGLNSSQRKMIKKRFLNIYNKDIRIIQKNGKLYLDFSKYDYSDLLVY